MLLPTNIEVTWTKLLRSKKKKYTQKKEKETEDNDRDIWFETQASSGQITNQTQTIPRQQS